MTTNATRSNEDSLRHNAASPSPGAKLANEEYPFDAAEVDKKVENKTAQENKDTASSTMKRAAGA